MSQYKKSTLLGGYRMVQRSAMKVLRGRFDVNAALEITDEASLRYKELMHRIPYIGGPKNKLTSNLIFSAQILSFIVVLEDKNIVTDEIGKIICEIGRECVNSFGPFIIILARALFFARFRLPALRKRAENVTIICSHDKFEQVL